MIKEPIDGYVVRALTDFGRGVNGARQLPFVGDGLKVVYRRVIYTALRAGERMTKTAALTGTTLATTHPHSSESVDDVIASLVRWGIFEGQGNFGMKMIYGDDIDPAAPRYTEARISPKWRDIFSDLMPFVGYVEAEIEGSQEPVSLPTPIPLMLLFSGIGIGYGVNCRIPMFTATSLYRAMQKDDPKLLRAPDGLSIDAKKSDLKGLWARGVGKITYRYKTELMTISSGDGVMISGSAEIFKPAIEKEFHGELERGQIYVLDNTSGSIPQVFIGRSPKVRAITAEEIKERCDQICSNTKTYRLTVTDGDNAYVIPLRSWLQETYKGYIELIGRFREDNIARLNFEYRVYEWLPKIVSVLMADRSLSAEGIVRKINRKACDLEVVRAVLRKPISTLQNVDSTEKLKVIERHIQEFKSMDPVGYTENLVAKL